MWVFVFVELGSRGVQASGGGSGGQYVLVIKDSFAAHTAAVNNGVAVPVEVSGLEEIPTAVLKVGC